MNVLKALRKPATAFLMASLLTACLTTPTNTSSVVRETTDQISEIDGDSWCEANKPERLDQLTDAEFDAMPEQAREKAVKDYEAWAKVCPNG